MIKFNWHHIILAVIIAVFFLMFLIFGTKLVKPAPEYGKYCDIETRPVLVEKNGSELAEDYVKMQECQEEYESNLKVYSNNLFLFTIIFVVLVVAISLLLLKNEAVVGGLLLGSLMFLIWGDWELLEIYG